MSANQQIIQNAIAGQHAYAEAKNVPEFAPGDGICWGCGRNIYDPDISGHYDVKYAMTHLITGCPYCNCHKTYCD